MDYLNLNKEKVSEWFKKFAQGECKGRSDLYYRLSLAIAKDDELIRLASFCRSGQPVPNLFFGAVHYLLLKNPNTELARYYPSIQKMNDGLIPLEVFKAFSLTRSSEIKEILQTKIVQTNALNRTAHLMPIISSLSQPGEAVNIIDIGASAGLNLNLDLYEYHYNGRRQFGNSPVKIKSEVSGIFPAFQNIALVNKKIGIDQNPIDVKLKEEALWLKALVWPDLSERFDRLENAIKIAQNSNIELCKASEIHDFETIIRDQDATLPLVVYHTHALYQFPAEKRQAFWSMLDRVGKSRNFYYLAVEGNVVLARSYEKKGILVELTTYKNGSKSSKLMAETNGHANWIKWSDK